MNFDPQKLAAALKDGTANQAVIALLKQMPKEGRYLTPLIRKLGSGYDFRVALYAITELFQPKTYCEVGVWYGWSMVGVAAANPNIAITGVDCWKVRYAGIDTPDADVVLKHVKSVAEHRGAMQFVTMRTGGHLRPVLDNARPELICLDGDDDMLTYLSDLDSALGTLQPGAVVVVDDLEKERQHRFEEFANRYQLKRFVFSDALVPFGVAWKDGAVEKEQEPAPTPAPKGTKKK